MQLENNSIKMGINAANNMAAAAQSGYAQEMENQRNMQSQATQRQRSLLEAINIENTYRQNEMERRFGYNKGTGEYMGLHRDANGNLTPESETEMKRINQDIALSLAPSTKLRADIAGTLPTHTYIDTDGQIKEMFSPRGYSTVDSNIYHSPAVANQADRFGIPRSAVVKGYRPFSGSIMDAIMYNYDNNGKAR